MSTYVLVPGAWHGAWCWYKVIPQLEAAGHRVIAVDLPSFGASTVPVSQIGPHTWADYVCNVLDQEPGPVILVGHSRGGIILSQVAERKPGKIARLVYVSAFMVSSGDSLSSTTDLPENSEALIRSSMLFDAKAGHVTVAEDKIEACFYHLCPAEDVALARKSLRPEALLPLSTAVHLSDNNYGRISRIYIEALQDRTVTLPLQRYFQQRHPCEKVFTLDCDHSPFFSRPEELVQALLACDPNLAASV